MKTILYLVRHGETVDNASQLMQGQTQGRLNETGVGQARQLRDELAARRPLRLRQAHSGGRLRPSEQGEHRGTDQGRIPVHHRCKA